VERASRAAAQRLSEKLREAGTDASRASRRAAEELELDERRDRWRRRATEWWRDADQRLGLSLRLREVREDVARKWPYWKRRAEELYATPLGKAGAVAGVVLLAYSGLLFRLISLAYLLFLLAPLAINLALSRMDEREREEFVRRWTGAGPPPPAGGPFGGGGFGGFGQGQPRARGPFGGFGGFGGSAGGGPARGGRDDGPVIDVQAEDVGRK